MTPDSRYFGSHVTCFEGWGCDPDEIRAIKKVTIHPQYDNLLLANDIAILELDRPVTTIKPGTIESADFLAGGEAMVLGWGVINYNTKNVATVLQEGAVNMLTRADCSTAPYKYKRRMLSPGMMCGYAVGRDACQGDSGGQFSISPLPWYTQHAFTSKRPSFH
jgi:secreted trypsin-like serine protease